MDNAIKAYLEAATREEVTAAYQAMLEWSDASEGSEADDIDNMLMARGLPSLAEKLLADHII